MNYMTPGKNYTITFTQAFTMGLDKTVSYSQTNSFSVILAMPSPVISISAPSIVQFTTNVTTFTLNAGSSYDPALYSLTYQWDCPTYFGGTNCGSSSSLTLNKTTMVTSNYSIEYYTNTAHAFNLTVSTSDGRSSSYTQYVFIAPDLSILDNTYTNCGIKPYSTTGILGY